MKRKGKANIDEFLKFAMKSEVLAKDFYLNAAGKAQSDSGKRFFQELADFEQHHFDRVKEIIESREQGATVQPYKHETPFKDVRSEVQGEFEPNKDELVDVLTIGIKAEQSAHERYRKIAHELTSPEEKEIFKNLAEDERRHQGLLEAQFYQLSNRGMIIWE